MKKLFDETHEYSNSDYRRTLWYISDESESVIDSIFGSSDENEGMIIPVDFSAMIGEIGEIIKNDLNNGTGQKLTETHWVFYSTQVNYDAIGDKVRFSIYIRHKDGKYECNINMSDFAFAASFDEVIKIKNLIEQYLNRD